MTSQVEQIGCAPEDDTASAEPWFLGVDGRTEAPSGSADRVGHDADGVVVGPVASLPFRARVLERAEIATDVVMFELGAPVGTRLPSWAPGAHIEVAVETGGEPLLRHYSLVGVDTHAQTWTIAVQLEREGRGGSRALHADLHEGGSIEVRRLANHFPLVDASSYVLLGAGIGITPIVSLAAAALRTGKPVRLIQLARSEDRVVDLGRWPDLNAADIELIVSAEPVPLPGLLGPLPAGTAVLACGPSGLLDALTELQAGEPWSFHCERFGPSLSRVAEGPDRPFAVELARSRKVLQVPADRSLLSVLLEHDVPVDFSCREGICSSCEVGVLDGEVDHHDSVLDEDERAENSCMMACVSRARGDRLVLDL